MSTIRYGVIGCSGAGTAHGDGASSAEGAKLVACADLVEEKAREFADEYDCEPYTNVTEMIEGSDVDAVSVATPSGTHAGVSIEAIEAGAHVLCEKPLDVYVDRVDRMVEAATEHGVTLSGIFQLRTLGEYQHAKRVVESGDLGQIVLGTATIGEYRAPAYYTSSESRGTREFDGGCMLNQGIHQIDALAWLMGGIESVNAQVDTVAHDMEMEDIAIISCTFENGAYGAIQVTTAARDGESHLEIGGTDGTIVPGERLTIQGEDVDLEYEDPPYGTGHAGQIQEFVTALIEEREPLVPGYEARKAVEVILASYASANLDREVRLDELRDLQEHT